MTLKDEIVLKDKKQNNTDNTIIELRKNFDVNKDIIFSEKVTAILLQNDVKSIYC